MLWRYHYADGELLLEHLEVSCWKDMLLGNIKIENAVEHNGPTTFCHRVCLEGNEMDMPKW